MASINKIRIGDTTYDIMPKLGYGLQFGTEIETSDKIFVNIGKATADDDSLPETGISITNLGFSINRNKFTNFLKALGFKTE